VTYKFQAFRLIFFVVVGNSIVMCLLQKDQVMVKSIELSKMILPNFVRFKHA